MPFTTAPLIPATDCPAPQVPASLVLLGDGETTPGGNAPVSRSYSIGDTTTVAPSLNRNATHQDMLGRYGVGAYAIAAGLELTAPVSGLSLEISAGHALIDGVVEVPADTTLAVPPSTSRVWIWLQQNGTLTAVPTSTTPPADACCLLGCVTTSGSAITAVDASGVMYVRGGSLWVQYGEATPPSVTPPARVMMVGVTDAGAFLWDGEVWRPLAALELHGSCEGAPSGSQVLLRYVAARAFGLLEDFFNSQAYAESASTGTATFTVKQNGSSVGTFAFAAGEHTPTFSAASPVSVAAGDRITVEAPGSPDGTLADVSFVLWGVL